MYSFLSITLLTELVHFLVHLCQCLLPQMLQTDTITEVPKAALLLYRFGQREGYSLFSEPEKLK